MSDNTSIPDLATRLIDQIKPLSSAAVALSGGVDSAVVAAAAYKALGDQAIAITGIGAAVSETEQKDARSVATLIGIKHIEIETDEITNPAYAQNDARRCYHCKTTLYSTLTRYAQSNGYTCIISGTNADDLGDYRPGIEAGKNFSVATPLADLNLGKQAIRDIASYFNLPISDKPASPCLASRIAYGQQVTRERLHRIEASESILRELGFHDVRVRLHADELARIELHPNDFHKLLQPGVHAEIAQRLNDLGFQYVTVDVAGRQSGSLNKVLPVLQ